MSALSPIVAEWPVSGDAFRPHRKIARLFGLCVAAEVVDGLARAFARRFPLHLRKDEQDADERPAQRGIELDGFANGDQFFFARPKMLAAGAPGKAQNGSLGARIWSAPGFA